MLTNLFDIELCLQEVSDTPLLLTGEQDNESRLRMKAEEKLDFPSKILNLVNLYLIVLC